MNALRPLLHAAAIAVAVSAAGLPPMSSAQSLYRPGQPEVLPGAAQRQQAEQQAESGAASAFRTAYQRANRPSFLLMWHRELSDDIDSSRAVSMSTSSSGLRLRDNYEREVTIRWKQGSERPVSLLPPARAAEFESGFLQALRSAGVRLVDRNTAIRMLAAARAKSGHAESGQNFQTLEADALAGYADAFLEVRFVSDSQARGGSMPRVTAIRSRSGEILADLTLGDTSLPGTEQWMASDRGFTRQTVAPTRVDEGRHAATALMRALEETWNQGGAGAATGMAPRKP